MLKCIDFFFFELVVNYYFNRLYEHYKQIDQFYDFAPTRSRFMYAGSQEYLELQICRNNFEEIYFKHFNILKINLFKYQYICNNLLINIYLF